MGLSWDYHGVIMGLSWGYHGVIMGLSWGYHGISSVKLAFIIKINKANSQQSIVYTSCRLPSTVNPKINQMVGKYEGIQYLGGNKSSIGLLENCS